MKSRYEENRKKRRIEQKKERKLRHKKMILFLIIIIILILVWGKFIEPKLLVINDYKLESEVLPNSFDGSRIVHFSDLHYGLTSEKQLKKIVNNINSLKPDIVVFTGDLIEENFDLSDKEMKTLVKQLTKINAKYGKYAVIGNHDVPNEDFDNIMYDSQFKVLKNNYDTVYNENNDSILIYGLDDTIGGEPELKGLNEKEVNNVTYKIVLVHEPDYIDEFINDYDVSLVLAGHSHNGQVNIPGINKIYLPKGAKKYYKKEYVINDTPIYISNGVGNSLINFRLFTLPSINIYRLYTK